MLGSTEKRSSSNSNFLKPLKKRGISHHRKLRFKMPLVASGGYSSYGCLRYFILFRDCTSKRTSLTPMDSVNSTGIERPSCWRNNVRACGMSRKDETSKYRVIRVEGRMDRICSAYDSWNRERALMNESTAAGTDALVRMASFSGHKTSRVN